MNSTWKENWNSYKKEKWSDLRKCSYEPHVNLAYWNENPLNKYYLTIFYISLAAFKSLEVSSAYIIV